MFLSLRVPVIGFPITNAAAYGKLHELGTLEAGKRANLIVVNGNPLDVLSHLYDRDNIEVVLKDGAVEFASGRYMAYDVLREEEPADRRTVLD